MIVLSVGMPRAGSGWYYNLTNDMMVANGAQEARLIRKKYRLQSILTEVNCNIGTLSARRLLPVMLPSFAGNTFVIKAHAGPTRLAARLIESGRIRSTYIYRDPRDAILSALENGKRARQQGRQNAFSHLTDFDTALNFIEGYLKIWEAWMSTAKTFHTRYEDLLTNYDFETERLAAFLGLDHTSLGAVIDKYRPQSPRTDQQGLHFSHGKIGRFRQHMTAEQQHIFASRFGPLLEKMGYEL